MIVLDWNMRSVRGMHLCELYLQNTAQIKRLSQQFSSLLFIFEPVSYFRDRPYTSFVEPSWNFTVAWRLPWSRNFPSCDLRTSLNAWNFRTTLCLSLVAVIVNVIDERRSVNRTGLWNKRPLLITFNVCLRSLGSIFKVVRVGVSRLVSPSSQWWHRSTMLDTKYVTGRFVYSIGLYCYVSS